MCVWVIAIDSYVKIYKNVKPKMRKRDEARHALNKVLFYNSMVISIGIIIVENIHRFCLC